MTMLIICSLVSFMVSVLLLPLLIKLSHQYDWKDNPDDERKDHAKPTPQLGGLAVILGLLVGLFIYLIPLESTPQKALLLLVGVLLLAGVGLRDDFVALRAGAKLGSQFIIVLLVIMASPYHIDYLYGFLGFDSIPQWVAIPLTTLFLLAFINAYNLIDGMDGLSASLGMVSLLFFGIWFYAHGNVIHSAIAFTTAAALLAFLLYNWHPASIFMGDTGSMVLGLLIGVLCIEFLNMNKTRLEIGTNIPYGTPALVFATVILPLTDMVRVFVWRIAQRRSPFSADSQHLHHLLLQTGLAVPQVVGILLSIKIGAFGLVFLLKNEMHWMILVLLQILLVWLLITLIVRLRREKRI